MKAYMYENDPDYIPLYLLSEQPVVEDDSEYQMSDEEWQEYERVVEYVENFHKKLQRWQVQD